MSAIASGPPDRKVTVESDGAARGNPGPAAIGAVVLDGRGKVLAEIAQGIGVATNNVAEYRAAIAGLERAKELGAQDVTLRADSRLLIEQLAGRFRVKNPTLIRLNQEARKLLAGFTHVKLEHVPRERNKHADKLANLGVDEWLAGEGADWEPDPPPTRLFEADDPS